jgi:hypothetical protein
MGMFLVFTIISIVIVMRTPFNLRRSLADACLEIPYEEDEWKKNSRKHYL